MISFGDGINDIPMFEVSAQAYAVDNANASLKERATAIILSNDQDAVAIWLKQNMDSH